MSIAAYAYNRGISMKNKTQKQQSETIRVWPDAANRLGIGKNAAYAAAARGELPVIRIGSRVLVIRSAFEKMLRGEVAGNQAA